MKITNPLTNNPFKDFAKTHSLVYNNRFQKDAHIVVRGVTLSNTRKDEFLVIGNIDNHDIQLLQRTVTVKTAKGSKHTYKLAIMHMVMPTADDLPHIFLDGNNRYHEAVYESIFTKFSKLMLTTQPYATAFSSQYRFFVNSASAHLLNQFFPQKLTDKLSTLGHLMDYEVLGDSVYIYLPESATDTKEITQMFSALKLIVKSIENSLKS